MLDPSLKRFVSIRSKRRSDIVMIALSTSLWNIRHALHTYAYKLRLIAFTMQIWSALTLLVETFGFPVRIYSSTLRLGN